MEFEWKSSTLEAKARLAQAQLDLNMCLLMEAVEAICSIPGVEGVWFRGRGGSERQPADLELRLSEAEALGLGIDKEEVDETLGHVNLWSLSASSPNARQRQAALAMDRASMALGCWVDSPLNGFRWESSRGQPLLEAMALRALGPQNGGAWLARREAASLGEALEARAPSKPSSSL